MSIKTRLDKLENQAFQETDRKMIVIVPASEHEQKLIGLKLLDGQEHERGPGESESDFTQRVFDLYKQDRPIVAAIGMMRDEAY